jgi:hypothetical protein
MNDDYLSRCETLFVYSCLILCCLILASACLYLGYKIGAYLA